MRTVLLTLTLVTVLIFCSGSALACVCNLEPRKLTGAEINAAISKEFNESVLVFSGEVITQDTFAVKFKTITVWKGEHLQEITMSTGAEKISKESYRVSSCDYSFKIAERYLVYARLTADGRPVARYCTRTNTLSGGKADIPQLDTLNPNAYQAPRSDAPAELFYLPRNRTRAWSGLAMSGLLC